MQIAVLYGVTALIFLVLDAIALNFLLKPVFARDIGDMLLEKPRMGAAAAFYLFYVGGLLFFVSYPALKAATALPIVFATAAFFGAICYGTYEFTNLATLKGWTFRMTAIDVTWGAFLNGVAATAGVAATRAILPKLI